MTKQITDLNREDLRFLVDWYRKIGDKDGVSILEFLLVLFEGYANDVNNDTIGGVFLKERE